MVYLHGLHHSSHHPTPPQAGFFMGASSHKKAPYEEEARRGVRLEWNVSTSCSTGVDTQQLCG